MRIHKSVPEWTDDQVYDGIMEKVIPSGECLIWGGAVVHGGYGVVMRSGRHVRLTRFLWERFHGPIPPGLCVRHKCDDPRCCNVEHLELGTHRENMRDMVARGRHARAGGNRPGEGNSIARLCEEKVILARILHGKGISYAEIARRFHVNEGTIRPAVQGKTWAHIRQEG